MRKKICWFVYFYFACVGVSWIFKSFFYEMRWIYREPEILGEMCVSAVVAIAVSIVIYIKKRKEKRKWNDEKNVV